MNIYRLLLPNILLFKSTIVKVDPKMLFQIMKKHWKLKEEYLKQMNINRLLLLNILLFKSTIVKVDPKMLFQIMKKHWELKE